MSFWQYLQDIGLWIILFMLAAIIIVLGASVIIDAWDKRKMRKG